MSSQRADDHLDVAAEGWTVTWQAPGESPREWCNVHVGQGRTEAFISVSTADGAPAGGRGRVLRARVESHLDLNHGGWRAEGVGPTEHASPRPVRYEWATFFPREYPVDVPGAEHIWQVVTQWHQQDGLDSLGDSPPVAFIVVGEDLLVDLRHVDLDGDLDESLVREQPRVADVNRGTWHHFRAEIVWAVEGGSVKVWHSPTPDFTETPDLERTGLMTLFPLRRPLQESRTVLPGTAYLKMGLYRRDVRPDPDFVVYHDEVRRLADPDDGVGC